MSDYTDKEILDLVIGGQTLRGMTAISFLQWVGAKLNGVDTFKANTQELLMSVRSVPMSNKMGDEQKVSMVRKLLALDIPIV